MKLALMEAGLPDAAHDAGSTAVLTLCDAARAQGMAPDYIYTGFNSWGRMDDLEARGMKALRCAAETTSGRRNFLLAQKYDALMISRPGPAAQWLEASRTLNLPVIYFGHDIHYRRLARGNAFLPEPERTPPLELRTMQLLERHIWQNARAVLYPTAWECAEVSAWTGRNHALAMPIYDLRQMREAYHAQMSSSFPIKSPEKVLFFAGGAHHRPNHDAMDWFTGEILPLLPTSFHLRVAGEWPEMIRKDLHTRWKMAARLGQTLEFSGRIGEHELFCAYRDAALVLAPLRYGAGVKRKVAEPLALGVPILTTPAGTEGLDIPERLLSGITAPAVAEAFAAALNAKLTADNDALREERHAYAIKIAEEYSPVAQQQVLEKAFGFF